MDSSFNLKLQLQSFILSMYDEGMINEQFFQIQLVKEGYHPVPDYAIRVITRYCIATKTIFSVLSQLILQEDVNFRTFHYHASDLYARSCCLGAENMRKACADLLLATERRDKNYCSQALYWVKQRFSRLRIRFEALVELERRIIDDEMNP